jgi:hypothetical protein
MNTNFLLGTFGKWSRGRLKKKLEENIKIDLREMNNENLNWFKNMWCC